MARIVRRTNPKGQYDQEREKNRAAGLMQKLSINTRVPSKWRFVDLETGDIWKWDGRMFRHADDDLVTIKKS
jgi:hypothetical protein